jgi:glyoxylase-like metal-dependent hydrolase (beta-lactamase superfamily II)
MSGTFLSKLALSAVALAFIPGAALSLEAAGVLKRASGAMGGADLKSIRYTGDGTGHTFGQAYKPGIAWPKITVHSMARTINYETASMREEIVISRAEPHGGGGYPLVAQQRNDQFLSGGFAWNQVASGPFPGPRFVADRVHQMWITPHGALRAAMKNNATLQWQTKGGKSLAAVSFTEPGRFVATAYINEDFLLERIESRAPDAVLGDTAMVTTYSNYRDFGGVKFPMKIQQSQAGFPVLDVTVKDVQPNAPADIPVPDAVRNASERVTTEKIADGVWFVAGASHNSVAIEMKDHVVLVESPLGDFRMGPVIEQVKKLVPGKPIRYVVNSHSHFDHSGGLRTAVAEGATIITQAQNRPYFERAFSNPNKLSPDLLAKSGKKAKLRAVDEKLVLSDGTRSVEIHHIHGSIHTDTFLMAYLPKEKLLIEADAFTPGPPNAPVPAQANPYHVNLVENIERLKLSVDRILPLHGRVVPVAALYTAALKTMPK